MASWQLRVLEFLWVAMGWKFFSGMIAALISAGVALEEMPRRS